MSSSDSAAPCSRPGPLDGLSQLFQQGQRAMGGLAGQLQGWMASMQQQHQQRVHAAGHNLGLPLPDLSSGKPWWNKSSPAAESKPVAQARQPPGWGAGPSQGPIPTQPHHAQPFSTAVALASLTAASASSYASSSDNGSSGVSAAKKAELGRATWTLLHMLAAQFPDKPTRQQQRDAKELIMCLTRIYPCSDCASHFKEIVKRDPPTVRNKRELQEWTCRVHNTVNRSLGKPVFNCDVVASRWAPLDCGAGEQEVASTCDMTVGRKGRGSK